MMGEQLLDELSDLVACFEHLGGQAAFELAQPSQLVEPLVVRLGLGHAAGLGRSQSARQSSSPSWVTN